MTYARQPHLHGDLSITDIVIGREQTFGNHTLLQAISFNQQLFITFLALCIVFFFDVNDCTLDCRNALAINLS